ncbi:MAG: hypothetical protein WC414_00850 [Patescibacteria group bacterium]
MKKILIFSFIFLLPFFLFGCGKKDTGNLNNTEKQEENKKQLSIQEILNQNIEQECHFNMDDYGDNMSFEYTVYFKDGKVKIESQLNGQKFSTLNDNEYVYTWDESGNQGTKMKIDLTNEENVSNNETEDFNLDFNNEYNFNCEKKSIDAEKMSLPKNINFIDLSENFEKLYNPQVVETGDNQNSVPTSNSGSTKDMCSMCDFLNGSEKDSCLANLNC